MLVGFSRGDAVVKYPAFWHMPEPAADRRPVRGGLAEKPVQYDCPYVHKHGAANAHGNAAPNQFQHESLRMIMIDQALADRVNGGNRPLGGWTKKWPDRSGHEVRKA